jgi:hypothetical protein
MSALTAFVKTLPLLVAGISASATYPTIPADLTTPVQQRIAVNGVNSEFPFPRAAIEILLVNDCFLTYHKLFRLAGIPINS